MQMNFFKTTDMLKLLVCVSLESGQDKLASTLTLFFNYNN